LRKGDDLLSWVAKSKLREKVCPLGIHFVEIGVKTEALQRISMLRDALEQRGRVLAWRSEQLREPELEGAILKCPAA
jgi:hypothetical protein